MNPFYPCDDDVCEECNNILRVERQVRQRESDQNVVEATDDQQIDGKVNPRELKSRRRFVSPHEPFA